MTATTRTTQKNSKSVATQQTAPRQAPAPIAVRPEEIPSWMVEAPAPVQATEQPWWTQQQEETPWWVGAQPR